MAKRSVFASTFVLIVILFDLHFVLSSTDSGDVQALQILFGALNNPSQLINWKLSGGDPCQESWKGITCDSTSVVSIEISGLRLNGTMGYMLSSLTSLKTLDLSDNKIQDTIPYQLPPNLTSLNLARNNLSGNIPYSISHIASLNSLNLSSNSLTLSIGEIFSNLARLILLDLSFNNFSGNLPASLNTLSNMSTMNVQNNHLSGTLDVLSGLPLTYLNVAENNFSGWIRREISSIPSFIYYGNSFDNGPIPRPPYTPPPPGKPKNNRTHSNSSSKIPKDSGGQLSQADKKHLTVGGFIGIIILGFILVVAALLALVFCIRKVRRKEMSSMASTRSLSLDREKVNGEMEGQMEKNVASVVDLKPPPAEKITIDRVYENNISAKRVKSRITATSYTVASLQTATHSFSQEFLIGEGSLGRVYKAVFPDGKTMVVKKIDNAALSLQEDDNFLEAVSNMSRLRQQNIVTLLGYCTEHGQRLLVYEYIGNWNLHDMLHFSCYDNDDSRTLSWNARVRIALGTARALEYLHEVCLPSIVHRNFKSANILLDEDINPHLSDCGLAALNPYTERQMPTQIVGSFGYSAPEFTLSGIYTVKSDVYSFGVVMLELLTGRKPLDSSREHLEQSLVRWATPQLHDIDALSKMVDPLLKGMYPAKSLSRFADIIALCVQPEPEFRPPMSEVVEALVRLMQRASTVKWRSSDDLGSGYKTPPDHRL